MRQDWIETLILAGITLVFFGAIWAAFVGLCWITACRYLRRMGLDSDWEHVNHTRHGAQYKD